MVMVLPAKADDLGLFPRTHMVESELTPSDFAKSLVCVHIPNKCNTFLKNVCKLLENS